MTNAQDVALVAADAMETWGVAGVDGVRAIVDELRRRQALPTQSWPIDDLQVVTRAKGGAKVVDALGRPIHVGDLVACTVGGGRYGADLIIGRVSKLCPKTINVEHFEVRQYRDGRREARKAERNVKRPADRVVILDDRQRLSSDLAVS